MDFQKIAQLVYPIALRECRLQRYAKGEKRRLLIKRLEQMTPGELQIYIAELHLSMYKQRQG